MIPSIGTTLTTLMAACSVVALTFSSGAADVDAGASAEAKSKESATMGSTKILKWNDGKKAVFILAFDDSAPSAVNIVAPELRKRGFTGTFYINPGNPPFASLRKKWETEIPGPGIEYANHTFTHVGATSVQQLETELEKCNEVLFKCYPDRKRPRLISFGQPGGVPWTVSKADTLATLTKFHLVERPPFIGYPFQIKTQEQMLAVVDAALEAGDMRQLVFHGVGEDWLVTPMEMFNALLDKIDANREDLWVTDPISWHKYVTERTGAEVRVLQSDENRIRIQLSSTADPALYDLPLTLSTQVPEGWQECRIVQGASQVKARVTGGEVRYSALPGRDEISIQNESKN